MSSVNFRVGLDQSRVDQVYDSLSRPAERRYSSGFSVQNKYDEYGFWREVHVSSQKGTAIAWEAMLIDARGRIRQERLGNGIVTTHEYEDTTGRLKASAARSATGAAIQDFALDYDQVGNVLQRVDKISNNAERFEYDALNRITAASRMLEDRITVSYDPLGNILKKSKTGNYLYCDTDRTKVLCGLESPDGALSEFKYDAAGNMVQMGEKRLAYNGEGRVTSISEGWSKGSDFRYGADGELIHQESRFNQNKFEVTYLGDTELVREAFAPPLSPTPERTRLRHFISTPAGTLGFFEYTYWHFPYRHAAPMYGMLLMDNPLRSSEMTAGLTYFVKDQLGSLRATVNDTGEVLERFDYDPWGKRRQSKEYVYRSVRQGFTGHEHLDNLDLIHMGGRIYSPSLARFVSPDPVIQALGYSQSHNRYSYVLNNPLRFVDPSGYGWLDDFFHDPIGTIGRTVGDALDAVVGKPLRWIGEQLHKAGQWLQQNWKTVAVIAATVALGPAGFGLNAILVGAVIGGGAAALYGGSLEDVLRGAAIGAIGGLFYGGIAESISNPYGASALTGFVGGWSSAAQGGSFESGFAAAFITRIASPGIERLPGMESRVAAAAVIGGCASEVSGGSFENGAVTGAFSRIFLEVSPQARQQMGRGLSPGERRLAKLAFTLEYGGDAGFDYDAVRIVDGKFMTFLADRPMSPDGNIYWPGASDDFTKGLPSPGYYRNLEDFVHEMGHVWQYQQGENVLLRGMATQVPYLMGLNPGAYHVDVNAPYRSYNLEQRATSLQESVPYRHVPWLP